MRVLVTRPEPEASLSGARLHALGHEVLAVPLSAPEALAVPPFDGAAGALAVTSPRALRFFSDTLWTLARSKPVFAVGARTAEGLRERGCPDVRDGGGDVAALGQAIATAGLAPGTLVVHAGGEERAGDLAPALSAAGLRATRLELYRMVAAKTLPPALDAALEAGALDAALHFSKASAATLLRLAETAGRRANLAAVTHHVLSVRIGEAFPAEFRLVTAPRPDEAALLMTLGE